MMQRIQHDIDIPLWRQMYRRDKTGELIKQREAV
jgi:hypothetical protein